MLIHLLFTALRAASKSAPPAIGSKRNTPSANVTLECPFCHALGVGTHHKIDERTNAGWQRLHELYQCSACKKTMYAETMHNDGSGVLTVIMWQCRKCKMKNPAIQSRCTNCGT